MRRAIAIVLSAVLVTTPLKLVLAQAHQQEAVSVQQTAPPDSSGHRLIGVPLVTDNTSRLWEPLASKDAIADIFAEDGSILEPAPRDIPAGGKVAIVIVAVAMLVLLVIVLCGPKGRNCPTSST